MAGVLGNYEWLAGIALDMGAPIVAAALHIPGPVSDFAVKKLKQVLGMSPRASDEDLKAKVDTMDPEVAKAAFQTTSDATSDKFKFLTRAVEVLGEVDKTNITEVNETIRAELGKVSWWHWRHLLGYVVGFHIFAFPIATFAVVVWGEAEKVNAILNFPIVGILATGAALLGVVMNDTTKKGIASMTGEAPEGMVASTVRAVTGKPAPKK